MNSSSASYLAMEHSKVSTRKIGFIRCLICSQNHCKFLDLIVVTRHQVCLIYFASNILCETGGQCYQESPDYKAALSVHRISFLVVVVFIIQSRLNKRKQKGDKHNFCCTPVLISNIAANLP